MSSERGRHTIHSYFNVSPEGADGQWVLFYSSTTREGDYGDLRVVNRSTGEEKVPASGLYTEDAFRVACQHWISNGKRVVLHDYRGAVPVVVAVDVDSMKQRALARGILVGFALPNSEMISVYPPHCKNSRDAATCYCSMWQRGRYVRWRRHRALWLLIRSAFAEFRSSRSRSTSRC